jgi:sulfatase modifying factor 1
MELKQRRFATALNPAGASATLGSSSEGSMRRGPLIITLLLPASAGAIPLLNGEPTPQVPTLEEVVAKGGFTPTPTHSEIYRPGVVLLPNGMGGHDVVVERCVTTEPTTQFISQPSIKAALEGGVSAKLATIGVGAEAEVQKRLTFVDPEQRTISLSNLRPTAECLEGAKNAAVLRDLSEAVVVYDVLVAKINSTYCVKKVVTGRFVQLVDAEMKGYTECVEESKIQVPLGFKYVPLAKVVALGQALAAAAPSRTGVQGSAAGAEAFSDFAGSGGLRVEAKLREQRCEKEGRALAVSARAGRLDASATEARARASTAWASLKGELSACTGLPRADRAQCVGANQQWLVKARAMVVALPAGKEPVQTECGLMELEFEGEQLVVQADEVGEAEAMLLRLEREDGANVGAPWVGTSGYAMVFAEGGSFVMGSPSAEVGRDEDEVQHGVTLSKGFYVGRTEVTQGLWRMIMKENPSRFSGCGDTCPIDSVSWCDAVEFANKLSIHDGLRPAYSGVEGCPASNGREVKWDRSADGYRLPTEAEWEHLARAGTAQVYAGGTDAASVGWYRGNSGDRTHPVGEKQANALGVVDLSGNVWEWCWDWYTATLTADTDPTGAANGNSRVTRGGSWSNEASYLRVAGRDGVSPTDTVDRIGLRLVRSLH